MLCICAHCGPSGLATTIGQTEHALQCVFTMRSAWTAEICLLPQVSWQPARPLRGMVSISGDEDGLTGSSSARELSAALACFQQLLSTHAVMDAIGIEGCGDALRLLLQILSQV